MGDGNMPLEGVGVSDGLWASRTRRARTEQVCVRDVYSPNALPQDQEIKPNRLQGPAILLGAVQTKSAVECKQRPCSPFVSGQETSGTRPGTDSLD